MDLFPFQFFEKSKITIIAYLCPSQKILDSLYAFKILFFLITFFKYSISLFNPPSRFDNLKKKLQKLIIPPSEISSSKNFL